MSTSGAKKKNAKNKESPNKKKLSKSQIENVLDDDLQEICNTPITGKSGCNNYNHNTKVDNCVDELRIVLKRTTDKTYSVISNPGNPGKENKDRRKSLRNSRSVFSYNENTLSELCGVSKSAIIKSSKSKINDGKHQIVCSDDNDDENENSNCRSRPKKNLKTVPEEHETPRKKSKNEKSNPLSPLHLENLHLETPKKSFPEKTRNAQRKSVISTKPNSKNLLDGFNSDSCDDEKDPNYNEESSEDTSCHSDSEEEIIVRKLRSGVSKPLNTPAKSSRRKTSTFTPSNTPTTKNNHRRSLNLTPSMHGRTIKITKPSTPLQEARLKLHVSVLPKSLPCREEQFNDIYTFLGGRLTDSSGGCIYISGVPGTGKTATVNEVIRYLKKAMFKKELPEFEFVDINGMKISEPRQAYVQIWKQLTGETKTWEESQKLLQNRFTKSNKKHKMTLLLVDELDLLCTKRQDVVYNLLDWPTKANANLIVITIANTMDLPERVFMGRISSRLGLTRLSFPTYTFKQLEEIVSSRLKGFNAFSGETIQLVARKVAAVSGDARRALDICRRATEIAELNKREIVTMVEIQQALSEMIASPKIQAIKNCSDMEKTFLQAVCAEVSSSGLEEVVFRYVFDQMAALLRIDGKEVLNVSEVLDICNRLGSYRLLICEHSKRDILQRILLNVSPDDVHFAIKNA